MSTGRMKCPVCFDGTISRELWDMLYGKNIRLNNCGQSHEKFNELKIWIGKQIDEIDSHGCKQCWADCPECTCNAERDEMVQSFLGAIAEKMPKYEHAKQG